MKGNIGFLSFIIGIFGIAGGIEQNTGIVLPIILAVIGFVLIWSEAKDEKTITHDYTSNSNRPKFLP